MNRHIFVVVPSAYPVGGVAMWLDYLVPGLSKLGWRVTVGLAEGPVHHRPDRYLRDHPCDEWVPISCMTGTPEGRRMAVTSAINTVRPALVVAVNIPDAIRAAIDLKVDARRSPRCAMAIHQIQPDAFDDARAFGPSLDGVVGVNRLVCELCNALGILNPSRIHYAPGGVQVDRVVPPTRNADRLRIAYLGRLDQVHKRVLDIPPILRRLKEFGVPFRVTIAGVGPAEAPLRSALQHVADEDSVRFLGAVPHAALGEKLFAGADALLLTSECETGPLAVWEAVAHGLAIVSSSYLGSGLERALRHDDTALLFPVGDVETAAKRLRDLWMDPAKRCWLAQNGVAELAKRYTVDISVAHWSSAFDAILTSESTHIEVAPDRIPAGRLDSYIGSRAAETLRKLARRKCPDRGPGGEWPHSCGTTPYNDPTFWKMAQQVDSNDPSVCADTTRKCEDGSGLRRETTALA